MPRLRGAPGDGQVACRVAPARNDAFLRGIGIAPGTRLPARRLPCSLQLFFEEKTMGKYVLGWFLGVPLIVLLAIYFIAH